ncbi:quinone-dependent dihydroorotate dehydrogenase [Chondromyces crocatus]|uniref:Dihydroorotate dehydrogenase (quinone) n=1 Tax=Chondromyces crocatus TaxID=52 RepID=A0A0K1EGX7_CHOCO|nr:quinone-dependent dihydroorotate dehydrogenase [Chondromyces crocatus]AKT39853.1 dihydroorotate dehydrogenase [Chondromyces crocatus]
MYRRLRPLLFALPPHTSHQLGMLALAPLEHSAWLRTIVRARTSPPDPHLATRAMGLSFPSPLGIAGGFDKNAERARALAALGFGFLELGTITATPQAPNPPPNLFRLPADRALINRLGFPNQGATRVTDRILARELPKTTGVPVGVSIGKSRTVPVDQLTPVIDDYLVSFRAAQRVADFVVVNVSSPNTQGLRTLQDTTMARALLGAIAEENTRRGPRRPLLLKIAPDLDDQALDELLTVVEASAFDGVVATNTTTHRSPLSTPPEAVDAIGAGGLSGPPLRHRALTLVTRARARLGPHATIIGVGGVETADHALDLIRAGADLIQLYTGFIYGGPGLPATLLRDLSAKVAEAGVRSIAELRGAALPSP